VPTFDVFLSTYRFDLTAFIISIAAAALYLAGVIALRRRGHRWSPARTAAFLMLGVGLYAWVNFGFFGTYSHDLRWAFTTRIALLLFGVPLLMSLGRPIALAVTVLREVPRKRLRRVLKSWPVRLMSNAIFAPIFALVLFMFFITPIAGQVRHSYLAENIITVVIPILGLIMVLPLVSHQTHRSSLFITGEFMLAFVELMLDAIPGVVLSISNTVMDGVTDTVINAPAWFPNALNDQHFSGNLLWMIAEGADLPLLIMMMIRWRKSDRKEARKTDDLSEEEYEALVAEHLRGPRV
jgi:putative membrane protein